MTQYKILKNQPIHSSSKYYNLERTLDEMEIGDCIDLQTQRTGSEPTIQFISRYFKNKECGYKIRQKGTTLYLWKLEGKQGIDKN
tara:strand:- start:84 stop:338 length:255 start_codon:yes stop_codon:yes gene_type:complete